MILNQIRFYLSDANIFGNWIKSVDNRFKILIRVRVLAIIWSL
jgi:hypothetical protein